MFLIRKTNKKKGSLYILHVYKVCAYGLIYSILSCHHPISLAKSQVVLDFMFNNELMTTDSEGMVGITTIYVHKCWLACHVSHNLD